MKKGAALSPFSLPAVATFLTALTLLFSLRGREKSLGGFPAFAGAGGFLLKDLASARRGTLDVGSPPNAGGFR